MNSQVAATAGLAVALSHKEDWEAGDELLLNSSIGECKLTTESGAGPFKLSLATLNIFLPVPMNVLR